MSAPILSEFSSVRRWRSAVAAVVCAFVVATLLALAPTASTAASSAEGDPTVDAFKVPAGCAAPGRNIKQRRGGCQLTPFVKSRPTLIIWGDSHAYQQLPGLQIAARRANVNLVSFVMGACPPVWVKVKPIGATYAGRCQHSNAQALRYARNTEQSGRPVKVILASNWSGFRRVYREVYVDKTAPPDKYLPFTLEMVRLAHHRTEPLFEALGNARLAVDLVAQAATVPTSARCSEGRDPFVCTLPRERAIYAENGTRLWQEKLLRQTPGNPRLLDVNREFCNADICAGFVDGIYTWYDDLHLSATRARTLAPVFKRSLSNIR